MRSKAAHDAQIPKAEKARRKQQSMRDKGTSNAVQKVRGRGDYTLPPGSFSRMGEALGSKAGGYFGKKAGDAVAYMTGFGDYETNSLIRYPKRNDQLAVTGSSEGGLVITNTEFVSSVTSNGTSFGQQQLFNNPGLGNFPWVSQVARRFNKYRFKQLLYEYVTVSSDYTATPAMGTVCLTTNYDALDRAFVSMAECEATTNAVSGKPSLSKLHGVECARADDPFEWRYVRSGDITQGDLRIYDHSVTTLSVEGLSAAAGSVIGRLKVIYTVEFLGPIALGLPSMYLPVPICTRTLSTTTASAAGVGPYWGLKDAISASTSTSSSSPYGNMTFTIGGGTIAASASSYPVFDVTTNVMKLFMPGAFRITATWNFSTAPTTYTVSTPTVNGTCYDPTAMTVASGGVNYSTDKTMILVDRVVFSTGTAGTPCTVTLTPTGWGSTFVSSNAVVTVQYLGQT